ncbi:MAG TPA: tripartite tricarboxylate transporter substrate binding protein [Burkholderiales bacterium]|jgi:putative tricarboxylic transport membrane protein|nr:tripartite tricarboxylate transporter substrate binding protein [Burkholderiales bacterium]
MRTMSSTWVAIGLTMIMSAASAQGWKPERNVELTIPTTPGGSNDIAGRLVHKLWTELKLLPVSSSVVNRGGGEHIVAYSYIAQRTGDPYAIGIMSTPMLVNPIEGRTQLTHNDLTPIAYLITEPMIALVRADSPIKTGKDLVDALKRNPASLSIALTSTGHRVSVGLPMHKAGVNLKAVRMPAFKGGGETVTAVLGGHIDVLITSVSTSVSHVESGKMRGIAVSSTKRLGGPLASVPTWQELGYQSSGSWKGIVAPKGITPAQVAYWEEVMRKSAASDEMRQYAEQNQWLVEFKGSADTRKWLDQEASALKLVMTELGLVAAPK